MGYENIHYKLSKNALIMFVGINPHPGSYSRGIPFSNNKTFWYLLNRSGIINEPLETLRNDKKLKEVYENKFVQEYKLNFVNLIKRPTVDVSKLKSSEASAGIKLVKQAIRKYKPYTVCFIGKITYKMFKGSKNENPGYGFKGEIYGSKIFLCHFPIRGFASVRVEELKALYKEANALAKRQA